MRQVTQRLVDGQVEVLDLPTPALTADGVLVDVRASIVSAGTERTKVETARRGLIGKARARPDQVRKVLEKAQRDGVRETVAAVRSRLNEPSSLGYSAAGVVVATGSRVRDLAPGDRVACGGEGFAVHAELAVVPGNLAVRVPDGVPFTDAAFATLGSIALHAVRQADVRLGERVAVIGLGLVGQLAGRLLRAAGCHVIGIDLSPDLVQRARTSGTADVAFERSSITTEVPPDAAGCDAVVVAAATASEDPVQLAAELCRDRGRVVIVGTVGMNLPRPPYYGKELELRLSRSYGPGRYDRTYEERGLDYPIGYVRWTERRNMQAVLEMIAGGRLEVSDLITARLPVEEAPEAYARLTTGETSPLAIALEYQETRPPTRPPAAAAPRARHAHAAAAPGVGMVGAGAFARGTIMPALREAGFRLVTVASATGLGARAAQDRFGFARTEDTEDVVVAPDVDVLVVATRHATHAELSVAGLEAGKPVFVEKPPCLNADDLARMRAAQAAAGLPLVVGFNRRYAPLLRRLREAVLRPGMPFELLYRINAGPLPTEHWLNDPEEGGGRLLGEGCHFVDFACWFAGTLPARVSCSMRPAASAPLQTAQTFSIILEFPDGSLATILYGARGASGLGKEYVEAHCAGRSAVMNDFRRLEVRGRRRRQVVRARSRDKGHAAQFSRLKEILTGATPDWPPPLDSMAVTLAALTAARTSGAISFDSVGPTPVDMRPSR